MADDPRLKALSAVLDITPHQAMCRGFFQVPGREVADAVAEPSKTRQRRTVFVCEPDYRPGQRAECPNPLHDHPLPDGYIAASDIAGARLRRGWANPRCPDCGLYGWRRGRPLGEPYEPVEVSRGG